MAVAEAHRRVGAHHVEVAAAVGVPQPHALAALEHRRQRRVVGGAETALLLAQPGRAGAECGAGELGDPVRAAVVGVEVGAVLDDLECDEVGAGAQAQQHVGECARIKPASLRTGHRGQRLRVERVEVEAHAEAGLRIAAGDRQRIAEDGRKPAGAHLVHGEHAHAERGEQGLLLRLPGACADDAGARGVERGARNAGERLMAGAKQRRQRHAVDVAGVGGGVGVAVEMGVDPDQARGASAPAADAAPGAGGDRMVAAEHERKGAFGQRGDVIGKAAREGGVGVDAARHVAAGVDSGGGCVRVIRGGGRCLLRGGRPQGRGPFHARSDRRQPAGECARLQRGRRGGGPRVRGAERRSGADDADQRVGCPQGAECRRHRTPPVRGAGHAAAGTCFDGAPGESFRPRPRRRRQRARRLGAAQASRRYSSSPSSAIATAPITSSSRLWVRWLAASSSRRCCCAFWWRPDSASA